MTAPRRLLAFAVLLVLLFAAAHAAGGVLRPDLGGLRDTNLRHEGQPAGAMARP